MENTGMVIDTSVFIEHLRSKDKSNTTLALLPEAVSKLVSTITIFELFAGANTPEKVKDVHQLIKTHIVVSFTETTAQYAGEIFRQLRSENKVIEFRDILIAATALEFGLAIKTINTRDFSRIKNLIIL